MTAEPDADALSGLGALADPVRRRLYDIVAARGGAVGREEAAAAAGIARTLAAYHLDRLVEAGLLTADYERPAGRGGPGAGRPAKYYHRSEGEIAVTVPPRSYGLLAGLLADAVVADESGAVRDALLLAAEKEGRAAAEDGAELLTTLSRRGYEPVVTPEGDVQLRNCPFHQMVQRQPELVCALNHALLCGYLEATGEDPARAELAPCPGRCCVTIRPTPPRG